MQTEQQHYPYPGALIDAAPVPPADTHAHLTSLRLLGLAVEAARSPALKAAIGRVPLDQAQWIELAADLGAEVTFGKLRRDSIVLPGRDLATICVVVNEDRPDAERRRILARTVYRRLDNASSLLNASTFERRMTGEASDDMRLAELATARAEMTRRTAIVAAANPERCACRGLLRTVPGGDLLQRAADVVRDEYDRSAPLLAFTYEHTMGGPLSVFVPIVVSQHCARLRNLFGDLVQKLRADTPCVADILHTAEKVDLLRELLCLLAEPHVPTVFAEVADQLRADEPLSEALWEHLSPYESSVEIPRRNELEAYPDAELRVRWQAFRAGVEADVRPLIEVAEEFRDHHPGDNLATGIAEEARDLIADFRRGEILSGREAAVRVGSFISLIRGIGDRIPTRPAGEIAHLADGVERAFREREARLPAVEGEVAS